MHTHRGGRVLMFTLSGSKMPKSIVFPRRLDFNCSSEGTLQDAKMTVKDILEFRDMNRPAPTPKSGVIRSNMVRLAILHSPPFLGLKECRDSV